MHVRIDDREPTRVDSVQPEHRQHRRVGARRPPAHLAEYLDEVERFRERAVALAAPVVEVPGDDQRCRMRHRELDAFDQRLDLPLAPTLEQAQVHVDAMQRRNAFAERDLAMQQAAAFEEVRRDVEVLLREHRVARQDRVSVMAVRIHGVAAISDLVPERVGDELVLRARRPFAIPQRMAVVRMQHFLEEQDVDRETAQPLAQLVDDHAPRELRKALVDVVRRYGEARGCRRCHDRNATRADRAGRQRRILGWRMGFEPTTAGITIRDSTVELPPPLKS
jgi:hypothetical protein